MCLTVNCDAMSDVKKESKHYYYPIKMKVPKKGFPTIHERASWGLDLLIGLQQDIENCKVCGGLLPELMFVINDETKYHCIIYKVEDDGKVIHQTDYVKLRDYLEQVIIICHECGHKWKLTEHKTTCPKCKIPLEY